MSNTVLLVDDDPLLTAGLRRSLLHEGFDALTADDPHQALAMLEEREIDAIVSDYDMPGMNGAELLEIVCERWPSTVRLMLTGCSELGVAVEAINRGAVHRFFLKPAYSLDLAITLRQLLDSRRLARIAERAFDAALQRDRLLRRIEREHPGLTNVERDEEGAVVLTADEEDLLLLEEELRRLTG